MVNKSQQDAFVDDEADTCPLCVEEFDLSDRNFKPCPCGYQVCQFCFNNIKSNMNGLCPACRRPYDDKTIEWKVVSPEEFKADVAAQARKKAAARQKEAERKQVETLNRKHLAGLRVLQKNLVYVVGMDISGDEHALETLRGPNHFGQYGDIIKIVASKAKEGYAGHQSTGIYVTFARKEDAATCIAIVDGTPHEGRVLRAQYGTTKYCSSFLRNERCTNRNCMFLHETGDDSDSFSRQDLSSFNAASSQRSAPQTVASTAKITYQNPSQHIASPQPVPATTAQIVRPEAVSRRESDGDGPALPTTATWAKNPQIEESRRSSQVANRSTPSPKLVNAKPASSRPASRAGKVLAESKPKVKKSAVHKPPAITEPGPPSTESDARTLWVEAMKTLGTIDFTWKFDRKLFDPTTLAVVDHHPPLLNLNHGILQIIRRKELEKQELENAAKLDPSSTASTLEDQFAGGSHQLGGEPDLGDELSSQRDRTQLPFGAINDLQSFDGQTGGANDFANLSIGGRNLTLQQQRNISLLKSSGTLGDSTPDQSRNPTSSQHHSQLSNPFQSQNQQLNSLARHGRQTSRFTFSQDMGAASSSTSAKTPGATQPLGQTSQTMQKNFANTQPGMQSTFYSGVQGPPPGLKASGTPPISGGGMFGQGHGFASAMNTGGNFASGFPKNNEESARDLLRSRPGGDAGKLDLADPSILQARMHHPTSVAQAPYGSAQSQDPLDFLSHQGNESHPAQTSSARVSLQPKVPSVVPALEEAEFPPLIATQASTAADTNVTRSVKPAVPIFPRAETPKGLTSTTGSLDPSVDHSTNQSERTASGDVVLDTTNSMAEPTLSEDEIPKPSVSASDQTVPNTTASEEARSLTSGTANVASAKKPEVPTTSSPTLETKIAAEEKLLTTQALSPQNGAISGGNVVETPKLKSTIPVRNPRTLRLVTTAKADDSSSFTPVESVTKDNEAFRAQSAFQDSDVSSTKQPSTPVNEAISEEASLASAATSQPGTPNPNNRVHTGPSISKSKNQIKRERHARAKQLEEIKAEDIVQTDELVQAPIIARKKKVKKPKSSANIKAETQAQSDTTDKQSRSIPVDSEAASLIDPAEHALMADTVEAVNFDQPEPTRDEEDDLKEAIQQPKLTGASVLGNLRTEGILTANNLAFFLNAAGLNARHDINTGHIFRYESNAELSSEENEILNSGDSIIKLINPGEWCVVLPDRSVLRHLSKEEAERYVDLKFELDHNYTDTFNAGDYPREAWMNLTGNDVLTGLQVAPPLDGTQNSHAYLASDAPEPLLGEFASSLLRPDGKDDSYGALYPPRDQAENDEIEARMSMYTLEEAAQTAKASEELLLAARKETEQLEKKLAALVKKNRKILKDWQ